MASPIQHDGHYAYGPGVKCKRCRKPTVRYERTPENLNDVRDHALNQGKQVPNVMLFTDWCEDPACGTRAMTNPNATLKYVRNLDEWVLKNG